MPAHGFPLARTSLQLHYCWELWEVSLGPSYPHYCSRNVFSSLLAKPGWSEALPADCHAPLSLVAGAHSRPHHTLQLSTNSSLLLPSWPFGSFTSCLHSASLPCSLLQLSQQMNLPYLALRNKHCKLQNLLSSPLCARSVPLPFSIFSLFPRWAEFQGSWPWCTCPVQSP